MGQKINPPECRQSARQSRAETFGGRSYLWSVIERNFVSGNHRAGR